MKKTAAFLAFVLCASIVFGGAPKPAAKTVAIYPWVFDDGTSTSRSTAMSTLAEIVKHNGYTAISATKCASAYKSLKLPMPKAVGGPSIAQLVKFGKKVGANYVMFGAIDWHTRSIWVGSGPKTISTATVDASVLNVTTGKVSFHQSGISGRSDEKEDDVKLIAAVLITPIITAVSGGPKTPQEQRAVQIALARTFQDWNREFDR